VVGASVGSGAAGLASASASAFMPGGKGAASVSPPAGAGTGASSILIAGGGGASRRSSTGAIKGGGGSSSADTVAAKIRLSKAKPNFRMQGTPLSDGGIIARQSQIGKRLQAHAFSCGNLRLN